MAKQPNYYCLHCPHSGAMHSGPQMKCGGLDAAGDTCDCSPFVADLLRSPMEERKLLKVKSIDKKPTDEKYEKNLAIIERYRIISDESGHQYVIPVWKTEMFLAWARAIETDDEEYFANDSTNFNDCRVDGGLLTFTDPKVG